MIAIAKTKPAKPSRDFPLFPHNSGKWAKKIGGRMHYFGRWEDPQAALQEYQNCIEQHPTRAKFFTVQDACNHFLTAKKAAVDRGELSQTSFNEYHRTCRWLCSSIGKETPVVHLTPSHFARHKEAIAAKRNVFTMGIEITRVRTVFKWCAENSLITPVNFGTEFKRASAKAIRKHRRLAGKKLLTACQLNVILDECGVHMKAMVLLGINCGFGNTDCATLPISAVDLENALVTYPRPKTEVERVVPLWPETVAALRASAARRYEPLPEAEGLFFVMPSGKRWDNPTNPLPKYFRQAYVRAGLKNCGFYWLRHTFETIAGGSKDQVATSAIMGHVDASMSATYREEIAEERLIAVTEHVRQWLLTDCQ